jgi:DNA-binding GntR family transcriptional regulator
VLTVSDEEVNEILIPIRLALERFSFTKALDRMVDADFAELAKRVWLMQEAAKIGNLLALVEADVDFHEFVLFCSGQPHTMQVWRSIAPRIGAYFFRYGRVADLRRVAEEHEALLASLRAGDREHVIAVLEHHILVPRPDVELWTRGA